MKYTIELTNKQKAQMECIMEIVHRYVGFNPKLEPMKTTNIESTDEYQIGYKAGRKDGFDKGYAYCRDNTELIPKLKKQEYNKGFEDGKLWAIDANAKDQQEYYDKGYNKALEDESELMAYITQDFINNCYPNDKGYNLYDLNAKYGLARVLKDYKTYKEKKKAEEIKVGDEIYSEMRDTKAIVISIDSWERWICLRADGLFFIINDDVKECWRKTGNRFDTEINQLLSKLQIS